MAFQSNSVTITRILFILGLSLFSFEFSIEFALEFS